MKLYDITQEVFSCKVFPGDPAPERQVLSDMGQGSLYNLTAFSMCAHNGTHIDAPFHFLQDGKTVEQLELATFVGPCYVAHHSGEVRGSDAAAILAKAQGTPRILIAGPATVTAEGAARFATAGICLLGNESQSVGQENAPMQVHQILLEKEIALLEGVVLTYVPEGTYFLSAAPLCLAGADGAPCRAYLIEK
jgi:arylformamidase